MQQSYAQKSRRIEEGDEAKNRNEAPRAIKSRLHDILSIVSFVFKSRMLKIIERRKIFHF